MKKALCFIAAAGLILGLIVHIVSILGIYPWNKFPFDLVLVIGAFVVWLAAILELRKNPDLQQQKNQNKNPLRFLKLAFKDTPKPIVALSAFFFCYAIINSQLYIHSGLDGVPDIIDGKYVLYNHGTVIQEFTEAEYYKMKAFETRIFSGHWMAVYSIALGFLWPKPVNG